MRVGSLTIYPVKSCAGIVQKSSEVDRFGLKHDRRWMLVDEAGRFLTQRQFACMAHIRVGLLDDGLEVIVRGQQHTVNIPHIIENNRAAEVRVWQDNCQALVVDQPALNGAISEFLGRPCQLVYMPESCNRQVDVRYARRYHPVSFADGFPLLLTTTASHDQLVQWLGFEIGMDRFRPNLVIENDQPFEEDRWRRIRVGAVEFDVVKPCSRCVIPTIDPVTLEKNPQIFKVLQQHRQRDGQVYFGQNLVPVSQGVVRVGDAVEVIR